MLQYREIFTFIDSAKGSLINADGAKISRDDLLPRLILADEVIFYASFVNVKEDNNVMSIEPKAFDSSLAFKIIGDADHDNTTSVMFSYAYLPEKSDLANGRLAFHIKTNSSRFAEALKNVRSKKCDFVILGIGSEPVSTVVLAKDQFIAENRPCENAVFEDIEPAEMMTREELQLLLGLKSPLEHTHDDYAEKDHTHNVDDISGLVLPENMIYSAGEGLTLNGNVFAADFNAVSAKEHSHTIADISDWNGGSSGENGNAAAYTAGAGISISDGVISCTVEPGVTQTAFDTAIGDINSILDEINGEVI